MRDGVFEILFAIVRFIVSMVRIIAGEKSRRIGILCE